MYGVLHMFYVLVTSFQT